MLKPSLTQLLNFGMQSTAKELTPKQRAAKRAKRKRYNQARKLFHAKQRG